MAMMTAKAAVTRKAKFAMRENKSHAAGRPRRVIICARTGTKAIANAPPEIIANNRSGRLLAALNESCKGSVNFREIRIKRAKARTLSRPKKKPINNDVRARNDKFFIMAHTVPLYIPPSTFNITPVIYEAAGETMKAAALANSSGRPILPNGLVSDCLYSSSSSVDDQSIEPANCVDSLLD